MEAFRSSYKDGCSVWPKDSKLDNSLLTNLFIYLFSFDDEFMVGKETKMQMEMQQSGHEKDLRKLAYFPTHCSSVSQ